MGIFGEWTSSSRNGATVAQTNTVTVIMAKDDPAWYESSVTMGKLLKQATGASSVLLLKVNKANFPAAWKQISSKYVIIHTHGGPTGLYSSTDAYMTVKDAGSMVRNCNIELVVCTACQTAAVITGSQNMAAAISTKIAPKGMVIANQHVVRGADRDFEGVINDCPVKGWRAYRDGACLSVDFPASLNMELAAQTHRLY
ncbi:MAG: hypothetical protein E7436_03805 [Ruminococcaceae bacterium]|nr:hypothetical protein [Oscillospiraceae bacterium]